MSRWELAYEQSNSSHVHGNIHAIRFDPALPSDKTVWVASDGA